MRAFYKSQRRTHPAKIEQRGNGEFALSETPRALPVATAKFPKERSFNNFSVYKASKELNGVPVVLANRRAKEIRDNKGDPEIQEEYQDWLKIQEGKLALSDKISVYERGQIHKVIKKLIGTMKTCVESLGEMGVDVIAGLNYDDKMVDLCVNSGRILHKGHEKNGFTLSTLLNDQRRNLMFNEYSKKEKNGDLTSKLSLKSTKDRRRKMIELLTAKFKKDLPGNSGRWDLHPIELILNWPKGLEQKSLNWKKEDLNLLETQIDYIFFE